MFRRFIPSDGVVMANAVSGMANAVADRIHEANAHAVATYEDDMTIRQTVLTDLEKVLEGMDRSYREAQIAANGTSASVAFAGEESLAYQVCKNTSEAIKVIADKMTGVLPLDVDPRDTHRPIERK